MRLKKILCQICLVFLLGTRSLYSTPAPEQEVPIVILGSGIAALTAAVQASQAGLQPLIIAGPAPGGIITQSHSIQNWPGEIEISGNQLADKLQKQAEARGVQFLSGHVVAVDFSHRPFTITVQNYFEKNSVQKIKAQTCIIALGAAPRLLHVPGEAENLFTHIFTCAPCDGLRFKDKTVAVIGGGDGALTEAHYLSNLAKKVYLIVRKDHFKTIQPEKKEAILSHPHIEVLYNTSVGAFVKHPDSDMTLQLSGKKQITVQGAFLAIGSLPNTELFKSKLELDSEGYIVLKDQQETSVKGVFAAGDVSDKNFRQAMTAAGDATKAALQAQMSYTVKAPSLTTKTPKESPPLQEITSLKALRAYLTASQKPTVVYFYSERCPPCKVFRPTYSAWADQFQDKAHFLKLNTDNGRDCFNYYHIDGVPTVLILDANGKELHRASGLDQLPQIPSLIQKFK